METKRKIVKFCNKQLNAKQTSEYHFFSYQTIKEIGKIIIFKGGKVVS